MESTYCTVVEVTTYATDNGETVWSALASNDLTGAINNASGYSAGDRSIAVDGFGDDTNPISSGAVFTIATDSTATSYTVISSKYNQGTYELTFSPVLAELVADGDIVTFASTSSTAFMTRCVVQACKDILRYTKQLYTDGTLWLSNNTDLNKANIIQAIENARNLDMRDRAATISTLAQGSFSDGSISIAQAAAPVLHTDARFYVDKVLNEYKEYLIVNQGRSIGR
jgi:hypothetical protein